MLPHPGENAPDPRLPLDSTRLDRRRLLRGTAVAAAATQLAAFARGQQIHPPNLPDFRPLFDVQYGRLALEKLDFYPPNPLFGFDGPWPVIICCHQGGWTEGSKTSQFVTQPHLWPAMRDRGFAVVHINYAKAFFWYAPDVEERAARAIQYVRYFAGALNVDPDRVIVNGLSSGAQIAGVLAWGPDRRNPASSDPIERVSSRPNALFMHAGPTDWDLLPQDDWWYARHFRHPSLQFHQADDLASANPIEKDQTNCLKLVQGFNGQLPRAILSFWKPDGYSSFTGDGLPPYRDMHDGMFGAIIKSAYQARGEGSRARRILVNQPTLPDNANEIADWLLRNV